MDQQGFSPTFLFNNQKILACAEVGLRHMTLYERANAELPLMGASNVEIARLKQATSKLTLSAEKDLQTMCLFIGFPRSGHTLLGSLLDAHPNINIAHELHILKFIDTGYFTQNELLWLMKESARKFALLRCHWGDYDYFVEGQLQGRTDSLKVIGDKKGGAAVMILSEHPELLSTAKKLLPYQWRFLQVVRNPYDNIATIARKDTGSIDSAIGFYSALCTKNQLVKSHLDDLEVKVIHHHEFLQNPKQQLDQLCHYLGLEAGEKYLDQCKDIIYESPNKPRYQINWTSNQKQKINDLIKQFDFLSDYQFDD